MKRILIIEDDPNLRHMVRIALENAKFEVIEAESGLRGLSLAQEHSFDCIVTDLKMPQMDGLNFIKEFKKIPNSSAPIIVFSSITQDYVIPEVLKAGATKLLLKDESSPKELVEAVHSVLKH